MVPLLVMKIFFYIAHVALDLLRRKLLLSSVLKIQSFRSKNYMTSLLIMKSFYAMLTQHYNQLRLLSTIPVLIPKLTPNLNSDLTLATIKNQLPHNKLAFFWPPPPNNFQHPRFSSTPDITPPTTSQPIVCQFCGKRGHDARKCFKLMTILSYSQPHDHFHPKQ